MMHDKALVLGFGSSGKAAKALLERLGYEVEVREDARRDLEVAAPVGTAVSAVAAVSRPRLDESFAFAVVSPGVPLTSPLVAECRARGIPLKSELQFGCEELKRRGWKLLAVTGSKGKSSVVKLVAEALGGVPCGNYGLPVSEVAVAEPSTFNLQPSAFHWAVVEVSSFQLEATNLPPDTFEAATILNLQEDHLDRHGSVEAYHALKRKLLGMARHSVALSTGLASHPSHLSRLSCLSLLAGSYFDNEILRDNGCLAIGLLRVAGIDDVRIAQAFREFQPLPHRMNLVAEIGGVRYVDDSKATSIAALIAGVKMAGSSVRLIAGGLPKGDDPKSALSTLTERVKKVYLIGESAEKFAAAWKENADCEICGLLERAVESARHEAVRGETVLLSPGTASFDQFKSFEERGEVFARLVKKERQDK